MAKFVLGLSDPWDAARPNQWFMFPYRYIDFKKVFYLSFSTNIKTRFNNREDTDYTPISPSVKNNPPHQATSALIH